MRFVRGWGHCDRSENGQLDFDAIFSVWSRTGCLAPGVWSRTGYLAPGTGLFRSNQHVNFPIGLTWGNIHPQFAQKAELDVAQFFIVGFRSGTLLKGGVRL